TFLLGFSRDARSSRTTPLRVREFRMRQEQLVPTMDTRAFDRSLPATRSDDTSKSSMKGYRCIRLASSSTNSKAPGRCTGSSALLESPLTAVRQESQSNRDKLLHNAWNIHSI